MNQETLKSFVKYDRATGKFWWLCGRRSGKEIGANVTRGHIQIRILGENYYAHRLAWLYEFGEMPNGVIDHINGDSQDNRIENLRVTDQSGNLENQRKARIDNKSSGLLGVSKKRNKWRAAIKVKGKTHHIGTFDHRDDAYAAYVTAKREMHAMGML